MALVRQAAVGHITEPIFMIGGQAYAPNGFTANFMADYTVDLDPEEFSIANDVLVCDSRSLGLNIAAGSRVTPVAYSNDGCKFPLHVLEVLRGYFANDQRSLLVSDCRWARLPG